MATFYNGDAQKRRLVVASDLFIVFCIYLPCSQSRYLACKLKSNRVAIFPIFKGRPRFSESLSFDDFVYRGINVISTALNSFDVRPSSLPFFYRNFSRFVVNECAQSKEPLLSLIAGMENPMQCNDNCLIFSTGITLTIPNICGFR